MNGLNWRLPSCRRLCFLQVRRSRGFWVDGR
jgi:hypothetical protein